MTKLSDWFLGAEKECMSGLQSPPSGIGSRLCHLWEETWASWWWRYCSIAQSCPTLCDPMDCSMPGFPVLHHPPELAQTHVHWVCDAIQPFCLLSSPSPSISLPQHQGLYQWGSQPCASGDQSIGTSVSASVLPVNTQGWFPLGLTALISVILGTLKSLLQYHSSKAWILRSSVFFMVQLSHLHTWLLEKP